MDLAMQELTFCNTTFDLSTVLGRATFVRALCYLLCFWARLQKDDILDAHAWCFREATADEELKNIKEGGW